jgi:hypothetical protein
MRWAIQRLARAAIIAPAIIACSSTLQATGQPLFATLGDVGFNLLAVFSEVEGVRRKITKAVIAQRDRRALQADAAPRRLGGWPESGGDGAGVGFAQCMDVMSKITMTAAPKTIAQLGI